MHMTETFEWNMPGTFEQRLEQTKDPVKNIMSIKRPLKLLHKNLFGSSTYMNVGGKSYGIVISDYSRFTQVFFLDDKT